MAPTTSVGIGSRHDDGADYDGFHDNDEGEEDDNDENWVYLYMQISPGVCLEKEDKSERSYWVWVGQQFLTLMSL